MNIHNVIVTVNIAEGIVLLMLAEILWWLYMKMKDIIKTQTIDVAMLKETIGIRWLAPPMAILATLMGYFQLITNTNPVSFVYILAITTIIIIATRLFVAAHLLQTESKLNITAQIITPNCIIGAITLILTQWK